MGMIRCVSNSIKICGVLSYIEMKRKDKAKNTDVDSFECLEFSLA